MPNLAHLLTLLDAFPNRNRGGRMTYKQRFWAKVKKQDNDCWIYDRSTWKTGYARFYIGSKGVAAHRIAYYLEYGIAPALVMHTCDNRLCVNPAHLRAGTPKENTIDMLQKGRHTHSPYPNYIRRDALALIQRGEFTQKEIGEYLGLAPNYVGHLKEDLRHGRVFTFIMEEQGKSAMNKALKEAPDAD